MGRYVTFGTKLNVAEVSSAYHLDSRYHSKPENNTFSKSFLRVETKTIYPWEWRLTGELLFFLKVKIWNSHRQEAI